MLLPNKSFLVFSWIALVLIACSTNTNQGPTPALFDTKEEAEKAAKRFDCKGSHKMGDHWMPCENHSIHDTHNH
ncbi:MULTISPECIES: DUF3721 domain-containing protein [unclassified Prochlorococcus]|uniref:DUF3721 domain-containing protein n=1 Tax=unclassified Prochlorococcus TaxID=2627481 RepID=UPI000533857F|nr:MULTISPECIES: DUF3721 domain-containing protein [unclassified Prochlorococcus]KGG15595.1 protein family PM-24 [Prochlorococcus sp. MIT 0602]KGG17875.1 protein family PM-24 [Prochlorococcus sp. MIT 0603]